MPRYNSLVAHCPIPGLWQQPSFITVFLETSIWQILGTFVALAADKSTGSHCPWLGNGAQVPHLFSKLPFMRQGELLLANFAVSSASARLSIKLLTFG
jgi:hypothetical protein